MKTEEHTLITSPVVPLQTTTFLTAPRMPGAAILTYPWPRPALSSFCIPRCKSSCRRNCFDFSLFASCSTTVPCNRPHSSHSSQSRNRSSSAASSLLNTLAVFVRLRFSCLGVVVRASSVSYLVVVMCFLPEDTGVNEQFLRGCAMPTARTKASPRCKRPATKRKAQRRDS